MVRKISENGLVLWEVVRCDVFSENWDLVKGAKKNQKQTLLPGVFITQNLRCSQGIGQMSDL